MQFLKLILTLLVFYSCQLQISQAKDLPCKVEQWEKTIAKFEAADEEKPHSEEGILFVGSSSIRLWDLAKYFPEQKPLNRGFGGSEICQSTYYAEQLILKHKPRVVVLYAGDNDIAGGKSADQVHRDFLAFWKKLHDALPETELIYIAIKPSLSRWKLAPAMKDANEHIAAECEKNKQLQFVDIWQPMLGEDGKPRKELFAKDGLHLNDTGYTLWTKLVSKYLVATE